VENRTPDSGRTRQGFRPRHFALAFLFAYGVAAGVSWAFTNKVEFSERGAYRYIKSNGIPDHITGRFPNSGNPNRISEQDYEFRVPMHPAFASKSTDLYLGKFGVAINGVPFDPGAAEWWNNNPRSGWQYEAMSGARPLGLDQNNAHVQPNGAYHYHGTPTGLIAEHSGAGAMLLLGYAADGFPIYANTGGWRSSYRVKTGTRPGGPGGAYDGSFTADYEYVVGLGDLDECNGREGVTPEYPEGTYFYVITEDYPFIPRCWKGTPDASFRLGPGGPPPGGFQGGPSGRRPPPPPPGFGPP